VKAAGVPELAVSSIGEYERAALRLAAEPDLLLRVKTKLTFNKSSAPLFDTLRFARQLEAAYKTMSDRHARGLPPASFRVADGG
jgi:predicted O-linked N-acetylglucosamine transferase (SPINDLY family)